ncbi:hypothetical protein Q5H91_01965 [Sphingomonas sp. KR1UV-12]|uniref:Uncharacterized protein n=1 Tax=Sphingomonas aurea TaxID=3063994 RepID=A0ABT9EGR4_9SPHN|nr:hypothetical protein [Sphingomonas sp. KR1UV-12]MDP1025966.1 hypothetical protein [Sphingomonas sp. KR1UV-12]
MTGPPTGGPVGVMAHVLFFYALLLLATGTAFRFGGGPERAVATILLAATAATWAVAIAGRGYYDRQFHGGLELGILAVDAALVVALTGVALLADRFWPLWMTAIHAFGLIGHVAKALAPDILPNVYQAAHGFSAYPGLILLIVATHWHRRRMREEGGDRSWSISWPSPTRRWPANARIG